MVRFLLFVVCSPLIASGLPADFFEMRVRPVLAGKCGSCHGASAMSGLNVLTRESLMKGGKLGPAVKAGDPDNSLLIQVVRHTHERVKMPPTGKLADAEITALVDWVREGAVWPDTAKLAPKQKDYWAFQPVRKVEPPAAAGNEWSTPVDRFVYARLREKNLSPLPRVSKRVWLRRATLDLTGLPPSPDEYDAFEKDNSPQAYAKAVDRLLASPRYGERWGRYWLDVARYSDDKLNSTMDEPHPNSFRYRDWVIRAFNDDMPYDMFVKAQIAGDLLPDKQKYEPGLGFYAMSPEFQDDRVDATTRGFLALTVACAQCHDHKFDPIPQKDYYSLLGVFKSTKYYESPLAPEAEVKEWDRRKKQIEDLEAEIATVVKEQALSLAEVLAARTAAYIKACDGGPAEGLDGETLDRWREYLKKDKEHPYKLKEDPEAFQKELLRIHAKRKDIDEKNRIRLGGSNARRDLSQADLLSLERDEYVLWRDTFGEKGVLWYPAGKLERFLGEAWRQHLAFKRAELERLKRELPPKYAFLHAIRDVEEPKNIKVYLRGNPENLGDEAPRRFLSALCDGEPRPFTKGSGRLELAEAIASKSNPVTARVMVNRIWQHHFGQGIVRTASNFGQLGERPSNPELLDYLAMRFMESGWSIKAMHREIVLSRAFASSANTSSAIAKKNATIDPNNALLWRGNRQRLDVEAIRDSLLWASGRLDMKEGGPADKLGVDNNRRTVYGFVSRRNLDSMLGLFDFPSPNQTAEQRLTTNVPLQSLFFLNSGFMAAQSKAFAERLKGSDAERITEAYRILYGRKPAQQELALGLDFVNDNAWPAYAQVLLTSNEFVFVD